MSALATPSHQHRARINRTENRLGEIHPRLNRVHVYEDLLRTETIDQAIGQPPGKMAALLTAVADKTPPSPAAPMPSDATGRQYSDGTNRAQTARQRRREHGLDRGGHAEHPYVSGQERLPVRVIDSRAVTRSR